DCFWAGLPVVCTGGDELSERVEREGLGVTLPEEDSDAVAAGLESVLNRGKDAPPEGLRLPHEEYAWPVVAEPLVRFATSPSTPPRLEAERHGPRSRTLR